MRITNNMQTQTLLNSVNTNEAIIAMLQEQLASGHKVNSAADDPGATPSILNAKEILNKIDIYDKNITFLNGEIEVTEGTLSQVSDRIQRIRNLTIEASNGTNGTEELKAINNEVEQIKEHLVALANTQYENSYIFSGNKTNTQTYTITDDGSIIYNGTPSTEDYQREYSIAEGVNVTINLAGDSLFGYSTLVSAGPPAEYTGEGLFQTLNTLTNALITDPPDYDTIRNQIDGLDQAINTITAGRTQIGGIQNRLTMTQEQHSTSKITYEELRANLQDVDIAQVVSDLSSQQVSLQASLYASSQMMNISLLDYL